MLKKLIIRNFQNLTHKVIEFDEFVTIFVGKNDAGKSAIIRALCLVLYNRPIGRSFITYGRKQCSVELFFDEHRIKRVVGKMGYYSLDGKKFRAFRNSVPPEIAKVLSLAEINIQPQHNPLFWFGLTPGQVAKELNKLVDLDSIDKVQALVAKRLRDKKAELLVAKKRLATARSDCSKFRPVKNLHVKIDKLGVLYANATESHRIDSLASAIGGCLVASKTAETSGKRAASGLVASRLAGAMLKTGQRVDLLAGLLGNLERSQRAVAVEIPKLPELPQSDLDSKKLESLIRQNRSIDFKIKRTVADLQKAKENLEQQLGGRCPTCGGLLTNMSAI